MHASPGLVKEKNIHGPMPGDARWAVCSLETRVAFEMRVDGMSARHRYVWCWASHEIIK